MVLLFTFYTNKKKYLYYLNSKKNKNTLLIANKEKLYLHSALSYHKLWRDLEFWESAILSSIFEEIKSSKLNLSTFQENLMETIIREKNLVFSQLIAYSYNMQMFELDESIVKEVIVKIATYFNLYDLQIQDLKVCFFLNKIYFLFIRLILIILVNLLKN